VDGLAVGAPHDDACGFVLVDGETAGTGHALIIRGAHGSRLCLIYVSAVKPRGPNRR
jgi:hypothetical protein